MPSPRSRRPSAPRLAPTGSELEAMVEARFGAGKPGCARIDQQIDGPADVVYFDARGREVGREPYGRKADEPIVVAAAEDSPAPDDDDEPTSDETDAPALKSVHRDDEGVEDKAVQPARRGRPHGKKSPE